MHVPAMTAMVLLGLSLTRNQFPDSPFPTDPNNGDTLHAASTPFYPAGWRGKNRQMEQAEIENSNPLSLPQDMYGAFWVSAPTDPSSAMNAGTLSSLFAESYTQDEYANTASFPAGQLEGTTPSSVVTQDQNAATQEVSWQRERKVVKKREKDRERKRTERSNNARDYVRICTLLDIPLTPMNTLVNRGECLCFILVGDIERFIVLVVVEGLVEQRRVDGNLRHRLKRSEAYARSLKAKLAKLSIGARIVPTDAHTTANG